MVGNDLRSETPDDMIGATAAALGLHAAAQASAVAVLLEVVP
jgi:hypothetical protein